MSSPAIKRHRLTSSSLHDTFSLQVGVKSAMPRIIRTGYHSLNLIHYFTAGEDEVRAWTVKVDTPAPKAAGVIHTVRDCVVDTFALLFCEGARAGTPF